MSVRIKGRGDITVVDVADDQGRWGDVVGYVARQISKAEGFFRDERLALAIGDRKISGADLQMIHEVLEGQNITVVALHTSHPASYQLARQLGLEAVWEGASPPPVWTETGLGPQSDAGAFPFLSSRFGRGHSSGAGDDGDAQGMPTVADGGRPPGAEQRSVIDAGERSLAPRRRPSAAANASQSTAVRQEARDSEGRWDNGKPEKNIGGGGEVPGPEGVPRADEGAAVTPWGDASGEESGPPPYVYRGALRSGQTCRHAGTVIVVGDVNPGAQVISGGDVLVWGRLRGFVHAGAMGDERAIVAALDFEPVQLRIAGYIAMTPKGATNNPGYWFWKREGSGRPEVARVIDNQIYVDPWDAGGAG